MSGIEKEARHVMRSVDERDIQTILVPYDFSAHAAAALRSAAELAEQLSARLHLLHVLEEPTVTYPSVATGVVTPGGLPVEIRDTAQAALEEIASGIEAGAEPVTARVIEAPSVAPGILEIAREIEADLIVMGTHGRTGMQHAFLGSVAERTLRQAECPVLTLRPPDPVEAAAVAEQGA